MELGQLVEEEHAMMGEAHLSRAGDAAAATPVRAASTSLGVVDGYPAASEMEW